MNPSIIASNAASQRRSIQPPVGRRPNIEGAANQNSTATQILNELYSLLYISPRRVGKDEPHGSAKDKSAERLRKTKLCYRSLIGQIAAV
jgi:hypothetical protein